jgi:hypothetical protein
MLWSVDGWDFFKECLNSSEVTLSALRCRAIRPCADLIKKHLNDDEAIREEATSPSAMLVIVMLFGRVRPESSEGNGPRRAGH